MADKVSYRIDHGDSIPYNVNYVNPLFGSSYTEYVALGYKYPLNEDGTRSTVGFPVTPFGYRKRYDDNVYLTGDPSTGEFLPTYDQEYFLTRTKELDKNLQNDNRNWFERNFPRTRNLVQKIKSQEAGGIMNYSQYLQSGGNIQDKVAAMVQAAMSGDQKATERINQIMQAAESGDQQAQQLAQLIQQIAQQLQGQTEELETAEAYKKGGKVKKCACGSKTPKKELGGSVKKYLEAPGPIAKRIGYKTTPITTIYGSVEPSQHRIGNYDFGNGFTQVRDTLVTYGPGNKEISQKITNTDYFADPTGKNYKWDKVENRWVPLGEGLRTPLWFPLRSVKDHNLKQIQSEARGGKCPCQLKRIGGKLVEVDGCTGMPVKKK